MKAYSYIRFSSAQQSKGTSLERQSQQAFEYAQAHGWDLDTQATFQDLGVSAFRGVMTVERSVNSSEQCRKD